MILDLLSAIGAAYLFLTVGEYLYSLFRRNPAQTVESSSDETPTNTENRPVKEKIIEATPQLISIIPTAQPQPQAPQPAPLQLPIALIQGGKRESPASSSSSTTRSRRQLRRNRVESARQAKNSESDSSEERLKLDTPVAERPSYSRYRRHKRTHSAHFSPRLIHPSDPNNHTGYTGSSEFHEFFTNPSQLVITELPNDPQPQEEIEAEMPLLDFIKSVTNPDDKELNSVHWEIHKISQTQLPASNK